MQDTSPYVKDMADDYRIWEVFVRFFTVRSIHGDSYSRRKLKSSILNILNIRVSQFLGDQTLSYNQVAAFQSGASSQIQQLLNTVDIRSYEGCTYGMEVSMIVTDSLGHGRIDVPIMKVFYPNFKELARDRGRLGKDRSWLSKPAEQARLVEGRTNDVR